MKVWALLVSSFLAVFWLVRKQVLSLERPIFPHCGFCSQLFSSLGCLPPGVWGAIAFSGAQVRRLCSCDLEGEEHPRTG